MGDSRLGDEIDDFCIKCKRLTNHSIVSLLDGLAAKVRCRTCYHDHDFRNGEPMPSKKDLKKQQLFEQVLAGTAPAGTVAMPAAEESDAPPNPAPGKKGRKVGAKAPDDAAPAPSS